MDEHNNNDVQNDHNDGDQNHAEEHQHGSEQDQNQSEHSPDDSEQQENRSEQVPNDSAPIQNNSSKQHRTAPNCSEETQDCTITVREAARIFEDAGVPRTERAITKWCNRNARGITRLDACYNDAERKYYITPKSIEKVIKEERHKFQYTEYKSGTIYSSVAEDLSEQVRNERAESAEQEQNTSEQERNHSEYVPKETEQVRNETQNSSEHSSEPQRSTGSDKTEQNVPNASERDRIKELEMENYNLKVQLEGQKFLVRKFDDLVDGERQRHEKEKMALIDRLTDARHEIGTLEQKLLQLEAPDAHKRQPIDAESHEHREEEDSGDNNEDNAEHEGDNNQPHEGEWQG